MTTSTHSISTQRAPIYKDRKKYISSVKTTQNSGFRNLSKILTWVLPFSIPTIRAFVPKLTLSIHKNHRRSSYTVHQYPYTAHQRPRMSTHDASEYQLGSIEEVLGKDRFDSDSFRKVAEDVYSEQKAFFENNFEQTKFLVSLLLDNEYFIDLKIFYDAVRHGDRFLLRHFFSKVHNQILDKDSTLQDKQILSEDHQSFLYFILKDNKLPVDNHVSYKDLVLAILNDSLYEYERNKYKNTLADALFKFEKSHKIKLQPFIKTLITESELYNYSTRNNHPVIPDDYLKSGIIEVLLNQSRDIPPKLTKDLNFIDELKNLLLQFYALYRTNPDNDTAINFLLKVYNSNSTSLN